MANQRLWVPVDPVGGAGFRWATDDDVYAAGYVTIDAMEWCIHRLAPEAQAELRAAAALARRFPHLIGEEPDDPSAQKGEPTDV